MMSHGHVVSAERIRYGKYGALLCLIGCLWGCAFERQVATDPVKYNKAVAEARDQVLLLNIVRAMKRHPMQFSAVTQVRGSFSSSLSSALSLPFGPDAADSYSSSLSGSIGSGPTFDISVLESKKFMSGILSPIKPELWKYYYDLDWKPDFLLYLLVERVDLIHYNVVDDQPEEDKILVNVMNSPASPDDMAEFQRLIESLVKTKKESGSNKPTQTSHDNQSHSTVASNATTTEIPANNNQISFDLKQSFRLIEKPGYDPIGPPLSIGQISDFQSQVKAAAEKLYVIKEENKTKNENKANASPKYLLVRRSNGIGVSLDGHARVTIKDTSYPVYPDASISSTSTGPRNTFREQFGTQSFNKWHEAFKPDINEHGFVELRFVLRSPQGILYYLGEIARVQLDSKSDGNKSWPEIYDSDNKVMVPLFQVRHTRVSDDAEPLHVRYDGEDVYIVDKGTRSMACLSLVSQLLALHQESDELPTTKAVQTVGK